MSNGSARITFACRIMIAFLTVAYSAAVIAKVPQTDAAAAPAGDAARGKELFTRNGCYQCHNYEGHGGGAGAKLAPNPIPFKAFMTYVRAPRGEMPPYSAKVMSDQQLADIYAFLRSRPRPPAVDRIPLLNP